MSEPIKVADLNELTREEWLTARRAGLGGSDAAAVLGWSPWASPWTTYLNKAEGISDDSDHESMEWGRRLESVVADAYAERAGFELIDPKATYRHPDHDWMLASPDRFIVDPERDGLGLLEVKCTSEWKADDWAEGSVPAHYLVQWHHTAAVMGLRWGAFAALVGGNRLVVREIERDDEFIDMIVAAEEGFWHDHVLANVPPPMDGQESTTETLTRLFAESDPEGEVELDDEMVSALLAYREASAAERAAKEAKSEAGNVLRDVLGEAEQGTYRGVPVVTWRAPKPKQEIDEDALKSDFPEVYEKVARTVPQNRRISVARSKAAQELIESLSTDGGHHGRH